MQFRFYGYYVLNLAGVIISKKKKKIDGNKKSDVRGVSRGKTQLKRVNTEFTHLSDC